MKTVNEMLTYHKEILKTASEKEKIKKRSSISYKT